MERGSERKRVSSTQLYEPNQAVYIELLDTLPSHHRLYTTDPLEIRKDWEKFDVCASI